MLNNTKSEYLRISCRSGIQIPIPSLARVRFKHLTEIFYPNFHLLAFLLVHQLTIPILSTFKTLSHLKKKRVIACNLDLPIWSRCISADLRIRAAWEVHRLSSKGHAPWGCSQTDLPTDTQVFRGGNRRGDGHQRESHLKAHLLVLGVSFLVTRGTIW